MNLAQWTAHKRRVNKRKKRIEVGLEHLTAFAYPGEDELYLVTFRQDYRSDNFDSTRMKSQYWRHRAGAWQIVQEGGI
jgi:hypothetical protein